MLAKRRMRKSLRITSQVNENTHPRSDAAQHLIDGYQLTDTIEGVCSRDDDSTEEPMTLHVSKLGANFVEAFPDIWDSSMPNSTEGTVG